MSDIVKGLRGELLTCKCAAYSSSECCCDTEWPESLCGKAADTIEALRAENARLMKLLSDTNTYYSECIAEREDLKQETAELKRAVKTAVFADSAELKDCKAENAKLREALKNARADALKEGAEIAFAYNGMPRSEIAQAFARAAMGESDE